MQSLVQDVRYAIRMLGKSPAFTLSVIAMLTLGIGANTAIFTIFNATLLRPLPYANPERLVQIWDTRTTGAFSQMEASYPDYTDLREHNQVFEQLGGYGRSNATIFSPEGAEQRLIPDVSSNFFDVLGVRPILGRTFRAGEDGQQPAKVVVMSFGAWQRRFGGDPSVIGRTLTIDDDLSTIIGVLPQEFLFAPVGQAEFWRPVGIQGFRVRRTAHWFHPVGRLKPGISFEQARAELATFALQLEQKYPDSNTGVGVRLVWLRDQIVGPMKPILSAIMLAVGFVLLITSANVAGLLLARSVSRQKEITLRLALGASRRRIVQQLLTESTLLSLLGGLAGLLAAYLAVPGLIALIPKQAQAMMPPVHNTDMNSVVLLFSLAVSVVTGIFFGLFPALQMFDSKLNESLQEGARTSVGSVRHRLRNGLVIAEVAVSIVLLVGAGLLLKSLVHLLQVDPGFDRNSLLTLNVSLSAKKYSTPAQIANLQRTILADIAALPGVTRVANTSDIPLDGAGGTSHLLLQGQQKGSNAEFEANVRTVSYQYLSVMRIPLIAGRFLSEQDDATAPRVAVINQTMADKLFRGQDPIGKRVYFSFDKNSTLIEIVGIIGNENVSTLDQRFTPVFYTPYAQELDSTFSIVVRTSVPPLSLSSAIRGKINEIDPQIPVDKVRTMDEVISDSPAMFLHSYPAYLIGAFAAVALALATVGIYGLLAYSVAQRTREMGIRMALGAQARDLLAMVISQGMRLVVIGAVIGLAAGLAGARVLQNLLFNVRPFDPGTFIAVAALLLITALLASYVPARRATKIDPLVALRYE